MKKSNSRKIEKNCDHNSFLQFFFPYHCSLVWNTDHRDPFWLHLNVPNTPLAELCSTIANYRMVSLRMLPPKADFLRPPHHHHQRKKEKKTQNKNSKTKNKTHLGVSWNRHQEERHLRNAQGAGIFGALSPCKWEQVVIKQLVYF